MCRVTTSLHNLQTARILTQEGPVLGYFTTLRQKFRKFTLSNEG